MADFIRCLPGMMKVNNRSEDEYDFVQLLLMEIVPALQHCDVLMFSCRMAFAEFCSQGLCPTSRSS